MNEIKEMVSDEQIDKAWGNANFGNVEKREVIRNTLLKCVSNYRCGHTATCIVSELGLVNSKSWTLTKLGKQYLFAAYSEGISI